MMIRALRPVCTGLTLITVMSGSAMGWGMQDQPDTDSRIEAPQIPATLPSANQRNQASKAFINHVPDRAPAPRRSLMQTPDEETARAAGSTPASQITARTQSGSSVAQLSKSELEATLAQLSKAERRVLLQAIQGTDICDNPPQVSAVIALCQTRLETRSQEFTAVAEGALSAEEQLLRGDFDNAALPSVSQVIDRLARTSAASDDFSNQAIASIALAAPAAPRQSAEDELGAAQGLGEPTQALINAIINQLGGGAP